MERLRTHARTHTQHGDITHSMKNVIIQSLKIDYTFNILANDRLSNRVSCRKETIVCHNDTEISICFHTLVWILNKTKKKTTFRIRSNCLVYISENSVSALVQQVRYTDYLELVCFIQVSKFYYCLKLTSCLWLNTKWGVSKLLRFKARFGSCFIV